MREDFRPPAGPRFDQYSALISAACAGMCVVLVPHCLVTQELATQRVERLIDEPILLVQGHFLCYRKDRLGYTILIGLERASRRKEPARSAGHLDVAAHHRRDTMALRELHHAPNAQCRRGRSDDQKRALYRRIAAGAVQAGFRADDVLVSLTENTLVDWSLGRGESYVLHPGAGA